MNNLKIKPRIYFDGACPLCHREIEHYRNHPKGHLLEYIDVSSLEFDPGSEGVDGDLVQKYFHLRKSSGQLVTGVEAFAEIWRTLGVFAPLRWLANNRLARPFMDLGYRGFAEIRPHLPKRRNCQNGACKI